MRSKQDYLIQTQNGKTTIEKIGLKAIQREEIEYEFSTVLDIDMNHQAKATKDRTGLFMDKPEFVITEDTGKQILEWCNCGIKLDDVRQQIKTSNTIEQLNSIYNYYPFWYSMLSADFTQQKTKLLNQQKVNLTPVN